MTYSMKARASICDKLSAAGISHETRTCGRSHWVRGRTGTPGINMDNHYQYTIYVHRKDFERAMSALR